MNGCVIIEGHIQGLANARELGKNGIPVIVIDQHNCIARYSKYCKKFIKCPSYSSINFTEFLVKLNKNYGLTGWVLLPSNDHAVFNISKNKKVLEKYYKIITDDYDIISKIYHKKNLLNFAKYLNIPFPDTYPINKNLKDNSHVNFPVIIKGSESLTFYKIFKRKVFTCEDRHQLELTLENISPNYDLTNVILQKLIKSESIISFTCFAIKGEIKTFWLGEKLREHPFKFGTATFAKSIAPNETVHLSEKLIKELHYTGVCEIEYIFDSHDNKYKLIELNARTWLWVGLANYCGINYALYIYNYLNGISTNYPSGYKINIKWMNFWVDIIYILKGLIKREYTILEIIKSFKGKVVNDLFCINDPLPFFMMFVLLPYLKIKRN